MKYKAGQTVLVKTRGDEFEYVLTKDDIADIKKDEWDDVGFKIVRVVKGRKWWRVW